LFPQRLQRYLAFELGCELSSLFHWLLYLTSVKQPVQLYGAGSFLGLTGLNLAVAASTVSDLQSQLTRYQSRYQWQSGDLCAVWIGGNDIRDNPYLNTAGLAAEVGDFITQLSNLGVDHFIVPNLPDLGAVPEVLSDPSLAAARTAATLAYNAALGDELNALEDELNIRIEQLDVFFIFDHMLAYQTDFGLVNVTDPLKENDGADPDTYAFWDDIHPTTRSHAFLAAASQALMDEAAPIEIISWSINSDGELRQTWFANPWVEYTIQSGERLDQMNTGVILDGVPAYTETVPAPGLKSGFFRTVRSQ
ncbi:SGNH/GDSL hydrolase family protein, partial [Coraliomargarita parva]|uniref:SGNH/GDSL hydrolase family protein n=1 Tax=Coraliomargarita parva TaxID=3014050 RepID=UPI0022B30C3C